MFFANFSLFFICFIAFIKCLYDQNDKRNKCKNRNDLNAHNVTFNEILDKFDARRFQSLLPL